MASHSAINMKIQKIEKKGCCGNSAVSLKLDKPINSDCLILLTGNNFKEIQHYTKSGMLYVENNDIIISGIFGNDVLNLKCKKTKSCSQTINYIETLLSTL